LKFEWLITVSYDCDWELLLNLLNRLIIIKNTLLFRKKGKTIFY